MRFRIKLGIDRLFSGRSAGRQLGWIAALISCFVLVATVISFIFPPYCIDGGGVMPVIFARLEEVARLFFDPGNFPVETSTMPHLMQVVFSLLGAFTYTAVLITFVGNFVAGRVESYRKGETRYRFSDHILILGGSRQLIHVLKSLPEDCSNDIVILAAGQIDQIRTMVASEVARSDAFMRRINILRGPRSEDPSLDEVYASKAARIYIIGEDKEPEHDSISIRAWRLIKKKFPYDDSCPRKKCYLLLRTAASVFIFQHREADADTSLETIVINHHEAIAQKVLMPDQRDSFPSLDRTGIRTDDNVYVHLVIVGMTKMSFAMATTAAHMCHFPNFVTKGLRTRITFVDPAAAKEMNYFFGHLEGLEKLSRYTLVTPGRTMVHEPDPEYGDFLDIEWEFVQGDVASPFVRDMLRKWHADDAAGKEYLTLAFCNREGEKNLAGALYLPRCFYDEKSRVPLFVYHPVNSELTEMARNEIAHYKNLYPFGSLSDDYYRSVDRKLLEGKRLNYLYYLHYKGLSFTSMPAADSKELNAPWYGISYAKQMSSMFSASHIPFKRRSDADRALTAVVEHDRWNVERLLMGYMPLPKSVRNEMNQGEMDGDKDAVALHLNYKDKQFIHRDIAPYDELQEKVAANDTLIVDHMKHIAADPV